MTQTLQTWYRSTLGAKLNASDITCTVATAPTVTAWRMHVYSWSTHAWIKYTGLSGTTLTGVTFVSQTADPATTVTGTAFPAWTAIELVEMHDQMLDKQEWWTVSWDVTFSWDVVTSWSIRVPVYADATARDVAIPSPSNGMFIYNTALGIMQQYIAGTWTDTASWTTANATTSVAGKVEIATLSEQQAETDTGWTGATLSVTPSQSNDIASYTLYAGETITKWQVLSYEEPLIFTWINVAIADSLMWNTAANTKVSTTIMGSWVSGSTLKLALKKILAPVDNYIVRIETDSAWNPSGTLADANSTVTVAGTGLTTSYVDVTCTFPWSFTLTAWTRYHVVISRSGANDAVNYYSIWNIARVVRFHTTNLYNASWWTPATTKQIYVSSTLINSQVVTLASATQLSTSYIIWVARAASSLWSTVWVQYGMRSYANTWLTNNTMYYLSNTAGAIATTAGTIVREIWIPYNGAIDIRPSYSNSDSPVTNVTIVTGWLSSSWGYKFSTAWNISASITCNNVTYTFYKNWVSFWTWTWATWSFWPYTTTVVQWDVITVSVSWGTSASWSVDFWNKKIPIQFWRYI